MILTQQEDKKVYSDGTETERAMLDIACKYPGDLSQDYISDNSNYTINNTFSAVRQNILNWYPFLEHSSILEVGAGMGAVTGMLCDRAYHVTALEMSRTRADVIRARYHDRKNLQVISEDINTWDTDQRFDYVVFIGVLEYAAVFSDSHRPYDEFLLSIKRLLKSDGKILFAIENRFGLKYWLGGSEDHLQKPFVGIGGYSGLKDTPRTFSRRELEEILERTGFSYYRFYGVLPDYKFPELIYSDEYMPSYMNLKKVAFTYSRNSRLVANERDLYKDIISNGVFPFFANSFLVEASFKKLEDRHVVHVSAKGEVYREFRVSTVLDNKDHVYKMPMHKDAKAHINSIIENTNALIKRGIQMLPIKVEDGIILSDRYYGTSAQTAFEEALERNDTAAVHRLIDCLNANLLKSSECVDYNINNIIDKNRLCESKVNYGLILQKAYIDMTFYNSFWENGELIFFDQEWCFERVPLKYCLYYAIKSVYLKTDADTQIPLSELLEYVDIGAEEARIYDRLEEFLWSNVLYRQTDFYGADGYCNRYSDSMTLQNQDAAQQSRDTELQNENEGLHTQNAELQKILSDQSDQLNALQEIITNDQQKLLESMRNYQQKLEDAQQKYQEDLKETELKHQKDLQDTELKHQKDLQDTGLKYEEELRNYRQTVLNKEGHIELLLEAERSYQREIDRYRQEIQDCRQTIRNKEGHIELLLETEREYEREKHSRTYRMALVFRRISTFFLPVNSKRRFIVKMLAKGIRHPKLMLRMINLRRIRNFFIISRKEGMDGVNKHYKLVEEYENSMLHPFPTEQLDITEVSEAANKSIEDYPKLSFVKYRQPEVSIIIPVFNQFEYTYNCLESILKNSGDIRYEVIVADDCSTDLTRELEKMAKGICVLHNKKNLRFLLNCNKAAESAKGKYILFLNNDTQVQAGWLEPLVKLIEKDETIGMVGSKLIYPDGRLQEAGGIIWGDGHAWNYGNGQNPALPEFNYVKETDYISGAAIMIRRDLWKEIGGFDERYAPSYCEDSDLAFEVRKRGYKLMYQPLSVVVHFEGMSNGTDIHSGLKQYQVVNSEKMAEKWADEYKKQSPSEDDLFHDRDRSRNKKTILVIDHYVPMFDKDAGSRTIWQYINLFVEKGYNVKFMGDNFYPHEPYTTALQQIGVEVLYGPWYANNYRQWIKDNKDNIDFAFLNRPHITEKYIDFLKEETDIKCIYYGCDLHCMRIRREYELCHDKKLLAEAEEWKKREFAIMRKTDVNYYPSCVEIEEIHKIDASIPAKTFDIYVYEKFRENIPLDFTKREGIMFVGGFGHPPNEDAVLWFADKIFPLIRKKCDIPFYVVGANPTENVRKLDGNGVVIKGFVTDDELEDLYNTCRMAVVPLRYGAGVKGKVIEALYYGIPMITTSIGIEGITDAEQFVEIADTAELFAHKVIALYNDTKKLTDTVQLYQDYVKKHCSVEAVWNHIKDDFTR